MAAASSDVNTDSTRANRNLESESLESNTARGSSFMGLKWAPLSLQLERGRQTAAMLYFLFLYFILPPVSVLLLLYLLLTPLYWVPLGYGTWMIYDVCILKTSIRGGRRWLWNMTAWHYISAYFPVSLEKTADLDPSKNYILGYHPHGFIALGDLINFLSNATGFQEKFPGILPHPLTLKSTLLIPLSRELCLCMGIRDASKESIQWILTRQGQGNAVMIVIGGADEALEARPGSYNITLRNRKGFVKQAIRAGACLVPMFSFGENDIFKQVDNPPGSTLRYYQNKIKRAIGLSPPLIYGRGIFNCGIGPLPFRHPINTIVGKPIEVQQCDEPDMETINMVHKQYMDELGQLFDAHKEKYGVNPETKLNFV